MRMPSLAAKNPRTCLMKNFVFSSNFSQSLTSFPRSTSSGVQKTAVAFFTIAITSGCSMGKSTNRLGFSVNSGSSTTFLVGSKVSPGGSTFGTAGRRPGDLLVLRGSRLTVLGNGEPFSDAMCSSILSLDKIFISGKTAIV